MKVVSVESLAEFLAEPMWDSDRMIYRGVPDATYALVPSLGRQKTVKPANLEAFEERVLEDFRRRALPFLKDAPKTQIEWMFLAQHYGVPTRLLDWTTNPLIALYFAVASDEHPGADYAVYRTIHDHWLDGPFEDSPPECEEILAVLPPHSDVRMVTQEGLFTIHPEPRQAYTSDSLRKVVFPARTREAVRWGLRKLGYGPARAFPGLDGVALDVVERQRYLLQDGSIPGSTSTLFGG
ncbi:MAG: FRG domain-containing protein [Hydrogenophaga sp.]